jgi:UDP-glucose:(heptosyl)LPS alpha-1,3-glucosyltransferase
VNPLAPRTTAPRTAAPRTIPASPLRIALVVDRLESLGGGAERSTHEVAAELHARGHEVTIFAGRAPDDLAVHGATVRPWSTDGTRGAWSICRFASWARRQLRQGNFDATVAFTTLVPADVVEPWGGTVRETLARNVALRTSHASRRWKRLLLRLNLKQQTMLTLERRTLHHPQVKKAAALSRYVADQFKRHYHLPDDRIVLIPNAVEIPAVSPEDRQTYRRRIRGGFHVPDDSVVFVFAAMNPRLKGVTPLLHAAKLLADRGVNFTLLLAGRIGYAEQHLAAELGIRGRVRIIGTTRRMTELYCAADVTVLPSFYDPSSRVVIESLLLGTPAISTAFNGASDFILREDGRRCGRVIADPADVVALADAMAQLADPAERRRCAEATEGLAPQLSICRHVDQLEAVLREVIAKR